MHLKEVFIVKRFLASALALTVIASGLTACSSASEESAVNNANGEVLAESRESENGASDNEELNNSAFDGEPNIWRYYEGAKGIAFPACFEEEFTGPDGINAAHYYSYELDEDTKIWMFATIGGWTDEAPYWFEGEDYTQSLEDVPSFMRYRVVDTFTGPGRVDAGDPFNMDNTEFTIDDEQSVEIGGTGFIRQEGSATATAYGETVTVYFTVYYGLYEHTASDNRVVYPPFIVIVLSTDGSAEAREYMNEVADYAMTYES